MKPALPLTIGLSVAFAVLLACSSSSPSGGSPSLDASIEAAADATEVTDGADASHAPMDSSGPIDASGSCYTGFNPMAPDAASAQIYGSCIPHIADAAIPTCYESGHVGEIPDSGSVPGTLQMTCMSAPENGTWSTGPCDRTNVMFGCQELSMVGDVCATVTTTWYYPPATGADEVLACPPPFLVVPP